MGIVMLLITVGVLLRVGGQKGFMEGMARVEACLNDVYAVSANAINDKLKNGGHQG